MYLPTLGPGLVVAAAGALLLIATLFVRIASPERTEGVARLDARAAALIALSAGAGTIHLAVAAEHFIEFRLYGVFFVALGIAQIGWAAVVAIRGVSRPLLLAATGNALVVWLWSLSRTTGLPIGPTPGVPESVGFADVAATAFEAVLVGWVAWSLARPRRSSNRLERVGWALPLIVATVTIAAVLLSGGGHGGHA